MTRGKWVLLRSLLGMLGLLKFPFGVDSASLSGVRSANEIEEFRVCADLCDFRLAGKPCKVFCTSRRQFTIQSNIVVGEKDVVVSVGETRRDACCPTLCRHGIWVLFCTCDTSKNSNPQVPWVPVPWDQIRQIFCEDENRLAQVCPECNREIGDLHLTTNNEQKEKIYVSFGSSRISRSSMDADVSLAPRGPMERTADVTGEHDGVDAEVDFLELGNDDLHQWPTKSRGKNESTEFDFEKFCEIECARGNGGLACKCDIIP